jgi:hypothetical protein
MRFVRNGVAAMLMVVFGAAMGVNALAEPRRSPGEGGQAAVAAGDLDRLDATAAEIERQIQAVQKTDATLAAEAGKALAGLREEVIYLRVKLRRESSVPRAEYADLRDRLETLRVKVQGAAPAPAAAAEAERAFTLPVGTEIDVRLQTPLSSATAKVEQRFDATTVVDVTIGRDVVVPAGAVARGFVSSVRPAGRIDRTGSLTLSFDELVIAPRVSRLRASVVKALEPSTSQDATRIGAAAAVGAVLGGILGGGKGALLGVLIGGGGTIASTEGSDVDLPAGTVLRIRLDQPLEVWK